MLRPTDLLQAQSTIVMLITIEDEIFNNIQQLQMWCKRILAIWYVYISIYYT